MGPKLNDDETDDLVYFARVGDGPELMSYLTTLSQREHVSASEILMAANERGSTCLHMATGNGNLEITDLILEAIKGEGTQQRTAFLDATNEFGNTALHWAALGGHLEIVKLLLGSGASPALANDKNYVPLDLAGLNEHTDVVDYFLSISPGMEGEPDSSEDHDTAEHDLEETT